MSETKTTVVLADDQVMFVESLRTVINMRADDIEVVGVAHDGATAVEMVKRLNPDVTLLDVRMPRMDGVEAARLIGDQSLKTRVVMLTTFDDDEYVLKALERGAVGYILKSMPPEDLISSIRSIKTGNVLISPEVASRLVVQLRERPHRTFEASDEARQMSERLSYRETQIVGLLAQGLSNRDIARELDLAEQTIKNHVSVVYSKLGVHDRVRLARIASDIGIDHVP